MEVESSIIRFCDEFNYHIDNDFVKKSLSESITGFLYESKSKQTTISFYLLPKFTNNHTEFKPIHKRIWSENKADIYIIVNEEGGEIYYAKTLPKEALNEDIKIGDFSYGAFGSSQIQRNFEESQKKNALKKISMDSGLFIDAYRKRLKEIQKKKKKTVDQALINTISYLRENVSDYIEIENPRSRKEFIQVLIDRSIFIKFLEERNLLPKSIYRDFGTNVNSYQDILKLNDIEYLNIFFEQINKMFNGDLFKDPTLDKKYFTEKSLTTILGLFIKGADVRKGLSGGASAQLPLFDYEFNIIPVELLSNIYESFLEEKRKEEGIYYTPNPIIDIILKDTLEEYIKTEGLHPRILDPSCGSGNFLVRAFKKLIEYAEKNGNKLSLEDRAVLMQDCIFGVDKDFIATRITVFSLYLSLFDGVENDTYILEYFEFPKLLNKNILAANSLDPKLNNKIIFTNSKNERIEQFDIIIGNPPWGSVQKNTPEYEFYKQNESCIGCMEKSQAFIIRGRNWAHSKTHFGIMVKGTNFINIKNISFINFFFSNFILEKYYDLTKARGIIFEKAKFSASIIIFKQKNGREDSLGFMYYRPIESKLSKDLKILFLEKANLEISRDIIRDPHLFIKLLSGDKWDVELINKLQKYPEISKKFTNITLQRGISIEDATDFRNYINRIKNKTYLNNLDEKLIKVANKLNDLGLYERFISSDLEKFNDLYKEFINIIISNERINENYLPLINVTNIESYKITNQTKFVDYGPWLGRSRDKNLFEGARIYIRETIKKPYRLCAVHCEDSTVTDHNYILKIEDENLRYFFLALFNSLLASYYLSFTSPRYATKQNPEISKNNLENLPYPKSSDPEVFEDIVTIAKSIHNLVNGKIDENRINILMKSFEHKYFIENIPDVKFAQLLYIQDELIFEFYGLNGKERQRIRDFFIPENETVKYDDIKTYAETFINILSPYIVQKLNLLYALYIPRNGILDFAAIEFIISEITQLEKKKGIAYKTILEFIGHELIRDNEVSFIPGGQFEIYHNDCLYIIKPTAKKMWSKTKAIEDAISELEKIKSYYAR